MFVGEFAVYYTSYNIKIYFYILFREQNSKITRIKVQRSQTFLLCYLHGESSQGASHSLYCLYSLSRNSRCLYRSGDARGAYRSTLGYEFKVAHLAFQRLRRFLVYDLLPYSHAEYVSDKRSFACRTFYSNPKHPAMCIDIFDWRKEIVILRVMLLFQYRNK